MDKHAFILKLVELRDKARIAVHETVFEHDAQAARGRESALDEVLDLIEDLDD
jgi:hypothetical protein